MKWNIDNIRKLDTQLSLIPATRFAFPSEGIKQQFIADNNNIDIVNFYKCYLEYKKYPKKRVDVLINILFDIKIEMLFIDDRFGKPKELFTPLQELSFRQDIKIKSSIFFEKVMIFIYYLEEEKRLDDLDGNKTEIFFIWLNKKNNKWNFLLEYKKDIFTCISDRNDEIHRIRNYGEKIFNKHLPKINDLNKLLQLYDIINNLFYDNLILIVQGQKPNIRFWTRGMRCVNKKAIE